MKARRKINDYDLLLGSIWFFIYAMANYAGAM